MKTIIYPGSFDPITNGHIDLVDRASRLFDRVIVAVAANEDKRPRFTLERRIELASESLQTFDNVEVQGFNCLLTDFAARCNANMILRGLRAVTDFDFEFQLASMNRRIAPTLETLFLTPSEQHAYISSTLVREIAHYNGDVTPFVPSVVAKALTEVT